MSDRDPFRPPEAIYLKSLPQEAQSQVPLQVAPSVSETPQVIRPPDLTLQGVIWNTYQPLAIINNQVVKIGDVIAEATVVDIDKTGIIIKYKAKKFKIAAPAVSKTKREESK
jgi:hypothetical protein